MNTAILKADCAVTAAELAAELGKAPRVVRRALVGVPKDGERMVRGNLTATWKIESLPEPLQKDLQLFIARDAWQPEFPWRDVCPEQQADALKLQRALLPVLERHKNPILDDSELVEIGLRNYAREFGREISPERWRYLFNRTLERDRGAEQFNQPELFLPGNLKRATSNAPHQKPAAADAEFEPLHLLITQGFGDAQKPTEDEKSKLWKESVKLFRQLAKAGKPKKVKRRLLNFLWQRAPFLATSPNALRVSLDRKMQNGDDPNAYADGRCERRGVPTAPPYDPEQIKLGKLSAADCTGGHVVTALRELNEAGQITDPRIKRALDTAGSKSYLPASLRAEFKDVEAWRIIAKGERYARKMRPRRKLTYDGIFSMTALVGDDKTPDLYIAVPDGNGWWTPMRPQLILISDYRSDFIIGHGITPTPQYKVMDFYGPFKRIFKKFGLPRFIVREGGLWRNSHLANSLADIGKGTKERNLNRFSPAEIEYGLERRGVGFVGAVSEMEEKIGSIAIQFRESYCPNSKPVEGVIRLLTQYMERLPFYSGRREMDDCPQATRAAVAAVKSRKASPHEVGMLVWDQWRETVHALIAKHNSTKQEGRKLRDPLTGAPLSPEEAFDIFQNRADPPAAFDAQCEVLLSHIQSEVEVRAPDLRRKQFPCGFVELRGHTYCDEQTGKRIGQKLLAHWDPEFPETCTFTDLKLRNPFTVPLLKPNNALLADPQMALTTAQAQRTLNVARAEYHATKTKFASVVRQAFVAPLVKELNAHTKVETQAIVERQQTENRRRSNVASRARKLGPAIAAAVHNSDPRRFDDISEGLAEFADLKKAVAEETAAPAKKDYFLKPFPTKGKVK
jgi:hypothetical protein